MERFAQYIEDAKLDLRTHQSQGVKWLLNNEINENFCDTEKVFGGFLADEMGLGKTIQMTGLIVANNMKTLIVVPRSLLEQWRDFIRKTTDLSTLIVHGPKREKNISIISKFDVVITTYSLIIDNISQNNPLHKINWGRIIFDEAHHLRNNKTKLFKGAKMLISKIRWIVSGTPIQNSKNDFYSLCDQIGIPQKYYTNPNNLYNIVVKFILKRTKDEINLHLPQLNIEEIKVDWQTNEEKLLAQEIHSLLSFSNLNISEKNLGGKFGLTTLPLLMRAKQCCVYPKLLQEKVVEIIKHENNELDQDNIKDTLLKGTQGRSKINALLNKIEERIDNNNNKIIFCNYKAEIDIIEKELKNRKIKVEKFDGRCTQSDREKILKDKNIEVLILQIQTGCEGLNLQHFNEIYFVSPHWNPAIEDQAIARAHRIGQDKETYIFKFIMNGFDDKELSNCIEKHACNIQNEKREIMKIIDEDQYEESIID